MKFTLSNWNPFKFLRNPPDEKRANEPAMLAAAGSVPTTWPLSLFPDPLRLVQDMLRDPSMGSDSLNRWFGDYRSRLFQPRIDVVDAGDALTISAELPGMDRKDVEILVEDDVLVLRGEKVLDSENDEKGCYRLERSFSSFQRAIPLPEGVDPASAEAKFDKGVLTLRLPKTAGEKASIRKIEIK